MSQGMNINVCDRIGNLKMNILKNIKFNIIPLKKCYENGIRFGLKCKESRELYKIIYQLIRHVLNDDDKNINFDKNRNDLRWWENSEKISICMLVL